MSDSPNSLARPKVKVARLDKRIMYVIAGVGLLLVVILVYAVQNSNRKEPTQDKSTTAPITETDTRQPIQDPEQTSGLSMPAQSQESEEEKAKPLNKSLVTVVRPEQPTELEKQRMKEEVELRAFRIANMKAALNSPLRAAAATPKKKQSRTQIISTPSIEDIRSRHPLGISESPVIPVPKDDQQTKEDFLNSRAGKDGSWQLPYERIPGKPFELKTGAVINGIMISGINSDLPGQILGQVSQNIYDTATGQHLLIPQGSRMIGVYDSRVAVGQSRVLIAWNRIIFPDGSSITLGIMPGTDVGGCGGYSGDVDNHYLRIFGSSAIMSMVSGGTAYAMDKFNKGSSANNNPSLQDELGSALSSQLGQSTLSLLQSNMSIKPAISTAPGKRFNMVVTKDIVFARPLYPVPELIMGRNVYGLGKKAATKSWIYQLAIMLIIVLVAMGYATQQIAELFGYHKDLGLPVYKNFYWPWMFFSWLPLLPSGKYLDKIISDAQLVFAIPLMLQISFLLLFAQKPKGIKDIHGTAHWADKKEIKQAGLLGGSGVYVGGWLDKNVLRYLRHSGPEHIMAFAPTRSGKGVGLVLPTLLSWEGSSIVLDIKGENWALTSGWRKAQGHKVMKFDPTDATGNAARYNPLSEIRLGGPHAIPDAQNIASMIVDPDGKGLKDYWNKAAFSFLGGTILHCLILYRVREDRHATLNDLSLMLADEERDISALFEEMLTDKHDEYLRELFGDAMDESSIIAIKKFISAAAREMLNKAEAELSGVVSTAVANMALYRDPVVSRATSGCDFRINDLMNTEEPVSLYLVIRPSDIDRLRPLVRLTLNIVLRRLTENMEFENGQAKAGYSHRLLLMLDEFTSLGKMEIFERALAFMAGYGIKAYIIVQDLAQLQSAYGKEESIMSNCHLRIAYAPNKIETAQVLSKMTGEATIVQKKTSISGTRSGHMNKANVSISEAKRALLTPDECMRLPGAEKDGSGKITKAGDMLIFPAGFAPIYGMQILFFLDPEFLKRSMIPAPEKSDLIHVPNYEPSIETGPTAEELSEQMDELSEDNSPYEENEPA